MAPMVNNSDSIIGFFGADDKGKPGLFVKFSFWYICIYIEVCYGKLASNTD